MKRFLTVLAAGVILAATASPSRAAIIYTVTDGPTPGTFTITGSGSSGTGDDEFLVTIVNHSSSIIQQLHFTSSFNLFNFDGDGSPPGPGFGSGSQAGYLSATDSFTINNAQDGFVNFFGPTVFGPHGIAPGGTDSFAFENENNGGAPVDIGNGQIGVSVTQASPTPEPATLAVFGALTLGAFGVRRRVKATA